MTDESPVKPQSEVLFLLGGLNAKMDNVLSTQQGYEARLLNLENGLASVKALQAPRTPWWQVLSGIASAGAIIGLIILYFAP